MGQSGFPAHESPRARVCVRITRRGARGTTECTHRPVRLMHQVVGRRGGRRGPARVIVTEEKGSSIIVR